MIHIRPHSPLSQIRFKKETNDIKFHINQARNQFIDINKHYDSEMKMTREQFMPIQLPQVQKSKSHAKIQHHQKLSIKNRKFISPMEKLVVPSKIQKQTSNQYCLIQKNNDRPQTVSSGNESRPQTVQKIQRIATFGLEKDQNLTMFELDFDDYGQKKFPTRQMVEEAGEKIENLVTNLVSFDNRRKTYQSTPDDRIRNDTIPNQGSQFKSGAPSLLKFKPLVPKINFPKHMMTVEASIKARPVTFGNLSNYKSSYRPGSQQMVKRMKITQDKKEEEGKYTINYPKFQNFRRVHSIQQQNNQKPDFNLEYLSQIKHKLKLKTVSMNDRQFKHDNNMNIMRLTEQNFSTNNYC